jgi:hypothetical protein
VSFENKLTGKVLVIGAGANDLPGSVSINFPADLNSSLTVRAESPSDITSSVHVKYSDLEDLPSSVQLALPADLPSSVRVRPHNKMTGIVEVVEPPVIKVQLSPIEDTYAREDMPKLNYGRDHDMFVGTNWSGYKYRSFLRFAIDSIPQSKKIKSATLVLKLLNSRPAIPIGIYDVPQGEFWTEYGLTWDNQPQQGTLIKSYDSGQYAGEVRIDLTSYVSEWYEGGRSHNGFMLKALDEYALGKYKQYGTRESDSAPYLEIEYYDPTVYSFKRDDLKGSVFVFGRGESDLVGSVVINSYVDNSDLDGSVTVRDPKIPVEDDLPSSIGVNRDTLPSSVFVFLVGQGDLDSSVTVRNPGLEDVDGSVIVNRPELDGSVKVNPYSDLESSVYVKGFESTDLGSTVVVNAPEREGSVYVRPYSDIDGSVVVRPADESYLESSIVVNAPEREGSVYVKPYTDLEGSLTSRVLGESDLSWSIFIRSEYLASVVRVRRTSEQDIESSLVVREAGESDLPGSVIPRIPDDVDLNSTVAVRQEFNEDIPSSVIPRVVGALDIPSSVVVEYASNLPSTVEVRAPGEHDLPGSVIVRITSEDDLPCSIEVGGEEDIGYVFIM